MPSRIYNCAFGQTHDLARIEHTAMADTKIYLVPGFFGFTSLGAMNYFHRVHEVLREALDRYAIEADIIDCATQPTGSIRYRADRVLQQVIDTGGLEARNVHLVGHSTGGLDIRLLVTPNVSLRADDTEERLGERVRSVTTVSTPHFGTPLANFFTTFQGRHLLQVLTLLATTTPGRYAIFSGAQLVSLVASIDNRLGRRSTFLDAVSERILKSISVDESNALWAFLEEVSSDQGAIIQLTPEGTNLFNAAVSDRPGVDYHCAITAAPPPPAYSITQLVKQGRLGTAMMFMLLHKLTTREHAHYPYPSPAEAMQESIQAQLPFELDATSNDGIVPALSQLYGKPSVVVVGDHLDVVGQFRYSGGDALSDWLPSGSRFDEARFRYVWQTIAATIDANQT